MANVEYHTGPRGVPGFTVSVTTPSGSVFRPVIPAMTLVNSVGAEAGAAGSPLVVSSAAGSAALLTARLPSSAASTNASVAKASAGTVYQIFAMNTAAAIRYLKIYNKASAPTVGTDVPVLTIPIAAGGAVALDYSYGFAFSAGIAYALTVNAADADATAVAAGDVVGLNVVYA